MRKVILRMNEQSKYDVIKRVANNEIVIVNKKLNKNGKKSINNYGNNNLIKKVIETL